MGGDGSHGHRDGGQDRCPSAPSPFRCNVTGIQKWALGTIMPILILRCQHLRAKPLLFALVGDKGKGGSETLSLSPLPAPILRINFEYFAQIIRPT